MISGRCVDSAVVLAPLIHEVSKITVAYCARNKGQRLVNTLKMWWLLH